MDLALNEGGSSGDQVSDPRQSGRPATKSAKPATKKATASTSAETRKPAATKTQVQPRLPKLSYQPNQRLQHDRRLPSVPKTTCLPPQTKVDPKLANAWKTKSGRELSEAELLAMPDAEYMSDKQLDFFRAQLEAQKDDSAVQRRRNH